MDDDDVSDLIRRNKLPGRGQWFWKDKPVMERGIVQEVLTAAGIRFTDLRSRPEHQDPPDCEAVIDGQRCGIEVTQLIHEGTYKRRIKAIKARAAGEVPPKDDVSRYREWLQTKGEAYWNWNRDDLIAGLQELIDEKDKPEKVKGGPYDRHILVIATDEFMLDRHTVESFLTGATFKAEMLDTVLFGLSYHPGLQEGDGSYPVFSLTLQGR